MADVPVYEGVVKGFMHGSETNNVWHFTHGSAGSGAVATAIADTLLTVTRNSMLPVVSVDWKLDSIRVKQLEPQLSDEVIRVGIASDVGGRLAALPAFNAMLLQIRTGLGGRSNRGRKYIPGIAEADHEGGNISAALLALLQTFADQMRLSFEQGSPDTVAQLGVYNRAKKNAQGQIIKPSRFVLATQVNAVQRVATMVSRKMGRGA